MEQKQIKKKKYLFITNFSNLNDKLIIEESEIIRKLRTLFKSHIGKENSISPIEVFYYVFNQNPERTDIFKRNYLWSIIKGVLRNLRREGVLFVINEGRELYVLKTKEESLRFRKRIDSCINELKEIQNKADIWVKKRMYKNI